MTDTAKQKALEPHRYPVFIKAIGAAIAGMFFYSLYLLPQYYIASVDLRRGEDLLKEGQYSQAITELKKVVDSVPSSEEAKLLLAITYFSNQEISDDEEGLNYLEDIEIDGSDWARLSQVMPVEYQVLFETITE